MRKFSASEITFIANNLIPVLGVIFLGWNAFEIFIIYWAECVIMCIFSVLKSGKVIFSQGVKTQEEEQSQKKQVPILFALLFFLMILDFFVNSGVLFIMIFAVAVLVIFKFKNVRWLKSINSSEYLNILSPVLLQFLLFFVVCGGFLFAQYIAIIFFGAFSNEVDNSDFNHSLFSVLWKKPGILLPILSTILTYGFSYYKDFII